MSKETPEGPLASVDTEETSEDTNEAPRAKTPLEMVRERQSKLRGQQDSGGRGSNASERSGTANSHKRRVHQRKSG